MNLSPQEVERFYSIWFPLLYYVNQKKNLVSSFPGNWDKKASVKPEQVVPIRNALWEDDSLREAFIAENPAGLPATDLALVSSWKYRVGGQFFIYRHLKKYSVFISSGSPPKAYAIVGITSSLEDTIGSYLPIYVQAVLLPFEGRIIYDSLLSSYPVLFGRGIQSSLKDTYRRIQERQELITTLEPDAEANSPASIRQRIQTTNKKVLTAFQKDLGRAGLSPKMMEEHTGNIAVFAEESLLAQSEPRSLLDITRHDIQAYLETGKDKPNLVSLKRFLQFLRDTDRIDYDQAENLLAFLKSKRKEL